MKKIHTSERLKQLMKERNLKQIDILNLALPLCRHYKVRLGRNDISQYVSGKVEPGQQKLFILAKALNVREAWLMGLDVPIEPDGFAENKETAIGIDFGNFYTTAQPPILEKYNLLNTTGQQKADEYMDDLLENPKYTKQVDISVAAKETPTHAEIKKRLKTT